MSQPAAPRPVMMPRDGGGDGDGVDGVGGRARMRDFHETSSTLTTGEATQGGCADEGERKTASSVQQAMSLASILSSLPEMARSAVAKTGNAPDRSYNQRPNGTPRRFDPAPKLQCAGPLPLPKARRYLVAAERMLRSEGTVRSLAAIMKHHGAVAMAATATEWQLELMEAHGIERSFGSTQLDALQEQFGAEMREPMLRFRQACVELPMNVATAQATLATASVEGDGAGVDGGGCGGDAGSAHLFAPSDEATLQRCGELSRESVLHFCSGVSKALMSAAVLNVLTAAAESEMPAACVRVQREFLEHVGVEADFGCEALARVPAQLSFDVEVMRALKGFTLACQLCVQKAAMLRGGGGARVFTRKPGALQGEGELSKDTVLKFCDGVKKALFTPPVLEALAAAAPSEAAAMCVQLQREYLEHVGIEMDFGCAALSRVPTRFSADTEVLKAFKAFTIACQMCMQKAASMRAQARSPGEAPVSGGGSQASSRGGGAETIGSDGGKHGAAKANAEFVFPPSSTLQSKGELSRDAVLRFCHGVAAALFQREAQRVLANAAERVEGKRDGVRGEGGGGADGAVRGSQVESAGGGGGGGGVAGRVGCGVGVGGADGLADGGERAASYACKSAYGSAATEAASTTCVMLQREFLEHVGIEMDFGCAALLRVPDRFAGDSEVRNAFECFTLACRLSVHRALHLDVDLARSEGMEANSVMQPPQVSQSVTSSHTAKSATSSIGAKVLFFEPAAGPLHQKGDLSRDSVLRFCDGAAAALLSPRTLSAMAATATVAEAGALCVRTQREFLECVGIEKEFGCRRLGAVKRRFDGDDEVMQAFDRFVGACRLSVHVAKNGWGRGGGGDGGGGDESGGDGGGRGGVGAVET